MLTESVSMVIAIVVPISIVVLGAVFLGMRHERRKHEITHAERMKALELGRPMPDDGFTARMKAIFGAGEKDPSETGLAKIAQSMGIWVPISAFGIAWMSTGNFVTKGAGDTAIWLAAGAVGVTGVLCGTFLATRDQAPTPVATESRAKSAGGPPLDPDAYDVVGRRERTTA